jgi:hypothetical protein
MNILSNFLFLFFFLYFPLLDHQNGVAIGLDDFFIDLILLFTFALVFEFIFVLQLLHFLYNNLAFPLSLLPHPQSVNLSASDLFHNNLLSPQGLILLSLFDFLELSNLLQPLDFH